MAMKNHPELASEPLREVEQQLLDPFNFESSFVLEPETKGIAEREALELKREQVRGTVELMDFYVKEIHGKPSREDYAVVAPPEFYDFASQEITAGRDPVESLRGLERALTKR